MFIAFEEPYFAASGVFVKALYLTCSSVVGLDLE
jgi:hypothetical protein